MNPIMEDNNDELSVQHERLLKVQKAVRKATEDAWKQASSSTSPRSIATMTPTDQNNASFLLGMDLFGQDVGTLERGIRDRLEDVESELEKILLPLSDTTQGLGDNPDGESPVSELSPQELAQQAQSYQQKIDFLKKASLARSSLDEAVTLASPALTQDPDLEQSSAMLQQALQRLNEAEETVNRRDTSSSSLQEHQVAEQILDGIRQSVRRHRVELVHRSSSVLDSSIEISPSDSPSLSVKSSAQLQAAYKVLETLEGGQSALHETMRRLSLRLYEKVLSPILEVHRVTGQPGNKDPPTVLPWRIVEKVDQPTKKLLAGVSTTKSATVHRLEWSREEDQSKSMSWPVGAWKDTLQLCQRVLVFVQSRVLLERPALCGLVGAKLFGTPNALPSNLNLHALGLDSTKLGNDQGLLMEEVVSLLAKTCLPYSLQPAEVSVLDARKKELLEAAGPFCTEMTAKGLIDSEVTPSLIQFCQSFDQKYVEHRRCVLLNQARDILMNHDYHNTVSVGVDVVPDEKNMTIFKLHKSSVSETASQLMALVRQTMNESVAMPKHPDVLKPTLYRCAREMLSLFRAIIPASYSGEVTHIPRTAAVLHNDSVFLAHHCLTLGLEYKEQYIEEEAKGKLLQQGCIFVDMVPLFRELADEALGDMLDLQSRQLMEIVGSRTTYLGRALQSNESLHEWSEADTALAAGVYHLRHLAQAWKPILSTQVFTRSMGHLADVLLTLYWDQITSMATAVSPNARHFLLGLCRKATTDIGDLLGGDFEGCKGWGRFQALVHFLDLVNLSQVQGALTSGVFRQVASQELAKWILANYPETPERRMLLQTLTTV